ncbi:MAG: hypothetical protein ABIO94_13635 [Opitutaceae bacterium]
MKPYFRILVIPFLLLGSALPMAAAAAEEETIAVAPTVPSEVTRPAGRGEKGDGKRGQAALDQRIEQLDQRLQLTAAQKEQVKEIFTKELAAARGNKGGDPKDRRAALTNTRDQIRAILTPEQKAKFDKTPAEGRGAKEGRDAKAAARKKAK